MFEIVNHKRRLAGIVHEEACLTAVKLETKMDPFARGKGGGGSESLSAVELPRLGAVELGHVLHRVGIEARTVGADVDALHVFIRRHAENETRIGTAPVDGDIDLDDAVFKLHVLDHRRADQAVAAEVGDRLGAVEHPEKDCGNLQDKCPFQ